MGSIFRLRAINITLDIKENQKTIQTLDFGILKETIMQYKLPITSIGGYRSMIAKAELNKILGLSINENHVNCVIFIPWSSNKEYLDKKTREATKAALEQLNVDIEKKISNYKKINKCLSKGLENFNFV